MVMGKWVITYRNMKITATIVVILVIIWRIL